MQCARQQHKSKKPRPKIGLVGPGSWTWVVKFITAHPYVIGHFFQHDPKGMVAFEKSPLILHGESGGSDGGVKKNNHKGQGKRRYTGTARHLS